MKSRDFQNLPISGVNYRKITTKFYNSISLNGNDLEKAQKQAETQESKVLDLLKRHPTASFTKSEIKTILVSESKISERTPASSISRALSNLSDKGMILKLSEMRKGEFDKPNHIWQLKPEPIAVGKQFNLFKND